MTIPLGRSIIFILMAFAMAVSLVAVGSTEEAGAHPLCDSNPSWHDHYHFPYAHRDDWYYSHSTGDLYKHWYNYDHDYYQSTDDCT